MLVSPVTLFTSPKINDIQFRYYRGDTDASMSINDTIDYYYSSYLDEPYFINRNNHKRATPGTWFEAIAMVYNYLSENMNSKYNIIIREATWATCDSPFISVYLIICYDSMEETRAQHEVIKSLRQDGGWKNIIRNGSYCSDEVKPHIVIEMDSLGWLEYDDYLRLKDRYGEYLRPIQPDKNKKNISLVDMKAICFVLLFIVAILAFLAFLRLSQ